jgi:hypothetical protein
VVKLKLQERGRKALGKIVFTPKVFSGVAVKVANGREILHVVTET